MFTDGQRERRGPHAPYAPSRSHGWWGSGTQGPKNNHLLAPNLLLEPWIPPVHQHSHRIRDIERVTNPHHGIGQWAWSRGPVSRVGNNSPRRPWFARWRGEGCVRWSTVFWSELVKSFDFIPGSGMTGSEAITNLESSADTEDTVVGLLSRKTLDSSLDDIGLFGDQVVESGGV